MSCKRVYAPKVYEPLARADYFLMNKFHGVHDPQRITKACVKRFNPKNWFRVSRNSVSDEGPGRPVYGCSFCMDRTYLRWNGEKLEDA